MIDPPWTQLSGAVAGRLVGGFSGFFANSFQERQQFRRTRRNVACALVGEIDALRQHIENNYLAKTLTGLLRLAPACFNRGLGNKLYRMVIVALSRW